MRNLAGNKECDVHIAEELRRSMIPSEPRDPDRYTEVPSRLLGRLGQITFERAWTCWVTRGPVPLGIAWWLYHDPIGRTDIRVAGHAGCPAPEMPWIEVIDGVSYVTTYHIDSEVGLRLFADAIRGITPGTRTP